MAFADGSRLPRQHKKGPLKGIFGFKGVVEDILANLENQGTVPPQEDLEGCLIPEAQEPIQQLRIGCLPRACLTGF